MYARAGSVETGTHSSATGARMKPQGVFTALWVYFSITRDGLLKIFRTYRTPVLLAILVGITAGSVGLYYASTFDMGLGVWDAFMFGLAVGYFALLGCVYIAIVFQRAERTASSIEDLQYDSLQKRIARMKAAEAASESSVEKLENELKSLAAEMDAHQEALYGDFAQFFDSKVERFVEEQMVQFERQGRQLLIAGIAISVVGVIGYSVVAYLLFGKWREQGAEAVLAPYVYGASALSLAFIVVQFIAGWCLKQYRFFIDSATFLRQVKSIMERYALAYTLIKIPEGNKRADRLWEMLSEDIKWPQYYGTRQPDVNVMKEAMESLSAAVRTLSDQAKSGGKDGGKG